MLDIHALAFAKLIARLRTSDEIIVALDKLSQSLNLPVYGVWRVPVNDTLPGAYKENQNVFWGPTVPPAYWPAFWANYAKNGTSPLARLARLNFGPFTWTEGAKIMRLTGEDRWFQDRAREFGMLDGLYCPQGDIIVAFWSRKVVQIDDTERGILNFAASIAAHHLRLHMAPPKKKTTRKLSPSETKALLYYSLGDSPAEIARRLSTAGKRSISVKTVHSFLDRAREKLKAKSRAHAVRIAIHGRLITYVLFVGTTLT